MDGVGPPAFHGAMIGARTRTVRTVVADDDARVRRDFAAILELEPDIEVAAVAADGAAALEVCDRLRPDVVVLDVRMPVLDGIAATRRLRERHTDRCRVLVVTTFDLDDYVLGAVRAGAGGFLLKDQAPDQLAAAVRTIAAGDGIVSPRATARLLHEFVPPAARPAAGGLTDREVQLVRLMARGLSNEELAAAAFISRATVKTHVSNILSKLHLTSRIQIVVWAYEHGLAGPPHPRADG
jgi:DNA-binding NarL/FixJ family response regulator